MIRKRKLTKFPPLKFPLDKKGKERSSLNADAFMLETYDFLLTFYKGCFDAYRIRVGYKTLFICIENFAIVLKGLVKAVFGRELIIIRFEESDDNLFIKLEFNTSVVSDELRAEMKNLANEGGFDILFEERSATFEFEYISGAVPYVNSNSTRNVYNSLVYVFNNKNL